jgi:hypothetical protein
VRQKPRSQIGSWKELRDFLPRDAVDAPIITRITDLRMPGMPRPWLGSARDAGVA